MKNRKNSQNVFKHLENKKAYENKKIFSQETTESQSEEKSDKLLRTSRFL